MTKSCIEWVKVETATLLLFFEEMYVAEMTVHAKYIFINMHEYLDPLSPYNMGLICCNDVCRWLDHFVLFLFFYISWKHLQFTNTSQFPGKQHSPTDHSIFSLRPNCNVIKEWPLSTYSVVDGGCLFLLSPLLWSRNPVCSSLFGDRWVGWCWTEWECEREGQVKGARVKRKTDCKVFF